MGHLSTEGLEHLWSKIIGAFVKKETGKGLSTNDFTTEEKDKLAGIAIGANKYTLPKASATTLGGVKVGSGLNIDNGVLSATGGGTADAVEWDNVLNKANATQTSPGLMTGPDKSKLDGFSNASDYAKKTDITGVYKYKGSVASAGNLPTTGQVKGDVYNIQSASQYGSAGANVAWDGSAWDSLGEVFTITDITNAEIDSICV